MKPPKCKTCGVEEWYHVCLGVPEKLAERVSNVSNQIPPVSNTPTQNSHPKPSDLAKPMTGAERHAKWRRAHLEEARSRAREGMQTFRSRKA